MDWNPNADPLLDSRLLGLEYLAAASPVVQIAAPQLGILQQMPSTVTETIDKIRIPMRGAASGAAGSQVVVETVHADDLVPDVTTTVVAPNGCLNVNTGWRDQAASTSTSDLVAAIDDASLDTANYIENISQLRGVVPQIDLEFATGALFTGRRILGVRFKMVAVSVPPTSVPFVPGPAPFSVYAAGTLWVPSLFANASDPNDAAAVIECDAGEVKVGANQLWTPAQVQAFDGTYRVQIKVGNVNPSTGNARLRIYTAWLEVDSCDENRYTAQIVQTGSSSPYDATQPRWIEITPRTPTGGSGFAKDSGVPYVIAIRTARYGDAPPAGGNAATTVSVPYLFGINSVPDQSFASEISAAFSANGLPLAAPAGTTNAVPVDLTVAGFQSPDSQPYATEIRVPVTGTVRQEIGNTQNLVYAGIRVLLAMSGNPASLGVGIFRTSDDALYTLGNITADEWNRLPTIPGTDMRLAQIVFDPSTNLEVGEQAYLQFFAASGGGQWILSALSTVDLTGVAVDGDATYGGTADAATYGGARIETSDIAAVVFIIPDNPGGFHAVPFADPITEVGENPITGMPGVELSWTPVDDLGLLRFGFYEIQRNDDGVGWVTIARITDGTVTLIRDYGQRLGVPVEYRMRLVDSSGVGSVWTAEPPEVTVEPAGCGLYLSTNEYPELNVAYADVTAGSRSSRDVTFGEATDVTFRELYLRDFQVAFTPLEFRGDTFQRRLLISAFTDTGAGAKDIYAPIRDICNRSALSSVCVRDEDGNRWYAKVQATGGQQSNPGRLFYVTVTVTEVSDMPSPFDAVAV